MNDYKLTLLDEAVIAPGTGFELVAQLEIFPPGGTVARYTTSKRFAFRENAADADILATIEAWYNSQVDIHAARLLQANTQARIDALKAAVNRTETI